MLLLLALGSVADYPLRAPAIACVAAIAAVWMASWRAAAARPAGPEQTVDAPPPRRAFALGRAALVGVAGLGLAYFAFAGALTNIAHRRNPELALRFSPNDAVALTVRANTRFAEQRGRADAETVTLARHSIAALAINPAALQLLGFAATAEGGVRAGLPLMRLADRMSRRDVAVQLWLIEEAVARNAIPDALRHYDVTLRTSESAQALLFPVLTGALANDYMWPHFAPYIREPAPWLPAFVQYGVRNSRDPGAFGRLLVAAGGLPEAPLYRGLESELLIRIAAGSIPAAAQFHRSLRGADPRIIARMTFDPATTDGRFAPLSWQFYQNPAVSASFLASDSGDGLELQAALEPGPTIPLARKAAMLPPGRYRFAATQRLARAAEGASLTWTLRCGGDTGRVLWTAATSVTDTAAAARADLTIPADCPAVTLQLIGASGPSGADFIVSRLSWNRIG